MKVGGIFTAFKTSMYGLSSQMKKMEVISENIAHAEELPGKDGKVYNRKSVAARQGSKMKSSFGQQMQMELKRTHSAHFQASEMRPRPADGEGSLKVVEEKSEKLVYEPGHPKADENGYVKMPDINIIEEMVDLVSSSRTYEANVTVLNAAKQMAKRALEI